MLHYDGRAGGSRTPRYGFPLLTWIEFLAGGPFDPQKLGIGVGFRFGVVGGWRVGGGGVGGPIALNRGVRFRRNC